MKRFSQRKGIVLEKVIYWKKIVRADGRTVKMPFKKCDRCEGEFTSGNTFASKYCEKCASEIKKEKTRERVRKHRQKVKENE